MDQELQKQKIYLRGNLAKTTNIPFNISQGSSYWYSFIKANTARAYRNNFFQVELVELDDMGVQAILCK